MRVLIDADGCPVVKAAAAIAQTYHLEVLAFCDSAHRIELEGVTTLQTVKGADAADFILVNKVLQGDIVITQDYGLAAMVLAKGVKVMNQNGMIYSNENIDQLLFTRHLGKEMRRQGKHTKGPKKRTKAQDEAFKVALTRLIEVALNANKE